MCIDIKKDKVNYGLSDAEIPNFLKHKPKKRKKGRPKKVKEEEVEE